MSDLGLPDVERVTFAGDWHGDTAYARRMVHRLGLDPNPPQVILHTGDFGYLFTHGFLDQMERSAAEANLIIAFVDGNHEDFSWLYAQPVDSDGVRRLRHRVWHLPRGLRWTWAGKRFLALGGAVSVDRARRHPGASWWPQETLTLREIDLAIDGGKADIMVCHDTPAGYDIPGLGPDHYWPPEDIRLAAQHRSILAEVVKHVEPDYLWHGHYHVRYSTVLDDTSITGLNMNGTAFDQNLHTVDLDQM